MGVAGTRTAAVCHLVECRCRGVQLRGVRGKREAGFCGCLVGRSSGAGLQQGAFLQGADDGAHPFLDSRSPLLLGRMGIGCRAVFGGAARGVGEESGRRPTGAARWPEPLPEGEEQSEHDEGDDDDADQPAGCGRGRGEGITDPVPESVDRPLEQVGIVLVVFGPGQFPFGSFAGGCAGVSTGTSSLARTWSRAVFTPPR